LIRISPSTDKSIHHSASIPVQPLYGYDLYRWIMRCALDAATPRPSSEQGAVAAMQRVIADKKDVRHAIYRDDIGYVDFIWGNEGKPEQDRGIRPGAKGVAHLLEARMRKDKLTYKQACAVAENVARATVSGELPKNWKSIKSLRIVHNGYVAILAKNDVHNAWLLTGYEKW